MNLSKYVAAAAAAIVCGSLAACGGGSNSTTSSAGGSASSGGGSGSGGALLSAEAQSAATGDIPDTQVFLSYRDPQAGYSITYPEGWAQRGGGDNVTIQDKNNIIHIVVAKAPPPTTASVTAEVEKARRSQPSLTFTPASTVSLHGAAAIKISYSTLGAPNPVTGKRVQLLVDRYVLAHNGRTATLELATAKGVDNIDAYKRIAGSFTWL